MSDRWSLGILIGVPIIALILIGLFCALMWFTYWSIRERDEDCYMMTAVVAVAMVIIVGIAAVAYFPWKKEYHQWQHHGGEIERISSRLNTSGSGDGRVVSQRFVVSFKGDPGQWSCDDTRCSLLSVGDTLDVSCKRHYQWSGTPGYDCNYVRSNLGIK